MFLTQWPYILVLIAGIAYSICTISRNGRASVLALIGLSLMLARVFAGNPLLQALISLMDDDHDQALVVFKWISTTWSAIAMAMVIAAVFVGRTVAAALDPALRVHKDFAISQLRSGQTIDQVESQLAEKNLGEQEVQTVLESAAQSEVHRAGRRNLLIGVAILAVGLVITVGSYMLAAQKGGSYYVTHGLIVIGLIQSIRGLVQIGK